MSSSNGVHLPHQEDSVDSDSDDDRAFGSSAHSGAAYYLPISSFAADSDNDEDKSSSEESNSAGSNAAHPFQQNGFVPPNHAEYDVAALDLEGAASAAGVGLESSGDEEEEEERVRETEASISRAFREEESRRNAPLTPETTARVVEAMRGVAFHGPPPEWAERVPEDQWVHRLQAPRDRT